MLAPSSPGDSNAMFIVLKLTRERGKNNFGKIIKAEPVGSAFAFSEKFVFTACHNVKRKGLEICEEIGLVREFGERGVCIKDIIICKHIVHNSKEDEDFAVYERINGEFSHFSYICPEEELPVKNARIGIRDFNIGVFTVQIAATISMQSFHTKVSHYDYLPEKNKKRKYKVFDDEVPLPINKTIHVVGGRVGGSCGSPYFAPNGKVVGFHIESVDDGRDTVSVSNSYTSDRSHTSFSVGLVLCRLTKFKEWYDGNLPNTI